jgi:sterol desaturase/sphingolipid hydroxylase (fatty acid hydroxylase superfamily)
LKPKGAPIGEFFYHSNFKSPRWLKYVIQTPELHSIHHQLDVHAFNFGDLPIWDRLFGSYRDVDEFACLRQIKESCVRVFMIDLWDSFT